MENAWLDSLSEDWVSQPRSESSPANAILSLPSGNAASQPCTGHRKSSRIPLFSSRRQSSSTYSDSIQLPLNERSSNDNNISASQRARSRPSKQKQEISNGLRVSQTVSVFTTGSTRHHTLQHNSLRVASHKSKQEQDIPEWKRRLLHGEVAYGEQRDLFSPAGLENIFRPPASQIPSSFTAPDRFHVEDTTMPSSPPPYARGNQSQSRSTSVANAGEEDQISAPKELQKLKYKLVDASSQQFSEDNLSQSSSFHPAFSALEKRSSETQQNMISDRVYEQLGISSQSSINAEAVRLVSGQSDVRHEDLSPIFISRHNTVDGRIDYSALDLPTTELEKHRQDLATNDKLRYFQSLEGSSQLLPGNETNEREELAHIGTFVNLGRGGESEDGSFQQRMLSPSSLPPVDESAIICGASVEASTPKNLPSFGKSLQLDNVKGLSSDSVSPTVPRSPNPSPTKGGNFNSRPGSGSPLKLFGTYDTFTNQKLLRRLSQFEDSLPEHSPRDRIGNPGLGKPETNSISHTEMNEAYMAPSSPSKRSQEPSQNMNKFGDGDLDRFEFSEGSLESNRGLLGAVEESTSASPQVAGSYVGFNSHSQPPPTLESGITGQWRTRCVKTTSKERTISTRRSVHHTSNNFNKSPDPPVSHQLEVLDTPRKPNGDSEGKRLLHSPPKNPTPKRRRTLHKADISHAALDGKISASVKETHEQIQSVLGKKRKDARHEDNQQNADPQILAMRQILRPRTPTLSQRSNQNHAGSGFLNPHSSHSERAKLEQQEKIARVQAELDATVPPSTSTVIGAGQPMYNDSRKGSVTTQDFLDEAKKIMAGIRGKSRPSSGLASVEESESEHDQQFHVNEEADRDDSYEESTKEPFSRPPSRDGGPLLRLPQSQQDPEVLDHLKKYEEMSDMDGIIASSMKSISLAKDVVNTVNDLNRLKGEGVKKAYDQGLIIDQAYRSDPPNIRITEYPELQRKRKHSTSSAPTGTTDNPDADFPSHGSNESSGPSTGRSVPTGSSRGSESKHIIAPHTVSHLIPEQLAGMIFDRKNHIWVKQKVVSEQQEHNAILPFEDTDDDPFGDIPDLTVDETQELSRIKAVAARKREEARISEVQRYQKHQQDVEQFVSDRLVSTKPKPAISNANSTTSAEPSKLTRLGSSTTAQFTRLTSWSDASDIPDPPSSGVNHMPTSGSQNTVYEPIEEVEREISIHESRVDHKECSSRRRNVTISFSSPLASIIPPDDYNDGPRSDADESSDNDSSLIDQSIRRRSYPARAFSTQHMRSRNLSFTGRNFLARPVSRIDEQDEESIMGHRDDGDPRRNVSLVISTPLPARTCIGHVSMVPSSSVARYSEGILQLTPLSDFSMNQPDESFALEVSYIGQRRRKPSSVGKRSLSLSVKQLVQQITDIEPCEPFWEHIKRIELRGKQLQTLHMLSKFCSHLEELDVSDNEIGQLDGAPGTIRNLRIARNCLSDLSSWCHLSNLQYVDVSNNGLTSLEGFKDLIHLRSLRADNNRIQSLKGIMSLDGLISLRLRANIVQCIDFTGSLLQRLTDLDLKGNCVREVRNLQELRSLTTLNLEDNDVQTFARENCEIMWTLKYLKLGGNKLDQLDITQYPNIRLLYLDRNRIGMITGLLKARHLDSLSLREQQQCYSINQTFLNETLEIRKMFLSGNLLTTFQPSVDFLNLQYLELSNCGLETLPIDFGQMAPNLRVLNLNFNAIRDIKPLLGIVRLKKLYLAGNRLARLRKTTNVLAQFSSLTKVDLRTNPLTLGFYPPPSEKRMVVHDGLDDERDFLLTDPFTLPEGDRESDDAYAGRLDMGTKMRRRVYEMLMLGGCARLKMLDGLSVDRSSVCSRDKVWDELVKAELIYESVDEKQETTAVAADASEVDAESHGRDKERGVKDGPQWDYHSDAAMEERWHAEDSFA